jgi:hypothetical protein
VCCLDSELDEEEQRGIFFWASKGDDEKVREEVRDGTSVNDRDSEGRTFVFIALPSPLPTLATFISLEHECSVIFRVY